MRLAFNRRNTVELTTFIAAEVEGEAEQAAPAGAHLEDLPPDHLLDIDFDDGKTNMQVHVAFSPNIYITEDETNMQRHARKNAQDAIAQAKRKAQDFDTQAALERKTNEAIKLAKAQAHVRDEHVEGDGSSGAPLVDRTYSCTVYLSCSSLIYVCS